jgi:hypothetical protein
VSAGGGIAAVAARPTVARRAWSRPRPDPTGRALSRAWGLLFFNVLSFTEVVTPVIPIPSGVGKLLTQGALIGLVVAAFAVNPKGVVRPNLYLTLLTVMAVLALLMSIGNEFYIGSTYRGVRFLMFLIALWLLTPWWGRPGAPLLKAHMRCLTFVLGTVVLGLLVAPGRARSFQGRLSGVIWPIPPPQVAHYAAVLVGLSAVLWLCGLVGRRRSLVLVLGGCGILLLTHTRTALMAMLLGLIVAGLSLFLGRSRVRNAFAWATATFLVGGLLFAPVITTWLARGQSAEEATQLTGRTAVWGALLAAPRSELHRLLGFGLSNKSFNGLAIDSNWLASYQDIGLIGCGLIIAFLLVLLVTALSTPRSPQRALALFLITYCIVASFTEVGLGDASPYLLDLAVAASLLARDPRLVRP